MADATVNKIDEAKAEVLAEKAYAAATEGAKEVAKEAKDTAAKTVAAAKPAAKKVARKAAPAKKTAAKKAVAAKAAPAKAAAKKTVSKPAARKAVPLKSKDTIMAKTQQTAEDLTAKVKDAVADIQERAKTAMEKSNEMFAEMGDFSKGNIEALVESSKILAAGLQDMGKVAVEDGKTAIETMTADVKELASVKSPTDFFKLQGEMLRRNFDAAVSTGSKRTEAMVKLAGEVYAPVQNRVSLAIEKVKQAA